MVKIYLLKDPRTGKFEEVFEYPIDLASPTIRFKGVKLVTRELLKTPILVVPDEYLTEKSGYGATTDPWYASFEYLDYRDGVVKAERDKQVYEGKVSRVQDIFAYGTMHKRSCKTIFFTGPKKVYKQTFSDNWAWREYGVLAAEHCGHFRTIESLSLKGINDVFITGTFECALDGEVVENTQCKITVSVNC
jgi:hypothetical protein